MKILTIFHLRVQTHQTAVFASIENHNIQIVKLYRVSIFRIQKYNNDTQITFMGMTELAINSVL